MVQAACPTLTFPNHAGSLHTTLDDAALVQHAKLSAGCLGQSMEAVSTSLKKVGGGETGWFGFDK